MAVAEFVSYQETKNEKHLGIVTVKLYGKLILRFKWMERKDGKGCFPNAPSYKIVEDGEERYIPAILLDSRSEQEELEHLIRNGVKAVTSVKGIRPVQMEQSAFVTQPSYQPKQNDDCPF